MDEHGERLRRLAASLEAAGVDGLAVTNSTNVRYLTGFAGSNGIVLVSATTARLITDFRYREAVAPLRSLLDVEVVDRELVPVIAGRLAELLPGATRIGFEARSLSVADLDVLTADAPVAGAELVRTTGVVERLRSIKSDAEAAAIRSACEPLAVVYEGIAADGLVGRRERDVAWAIERTIRESGCDGLAFEPVVASGPNAASPHADPGERAIGRGELVVVDIGARVDGYCSDCTRTFAAGAEPSEDAAATYATVLAAQLAAGRVIRPGTTGIDADAAARRIIADAGHGDDFGHALGHGVGLDVHEAPTLRWTSSDVLEAGHVVSNEPGIYVSGSHGVRIEDLLLVTATGNERLTAFTTELVVTA
jgi:Xaa-Pro aminopeptidase